MVLVFFFLWVFGLFFANHFQHSSFVLCSVLPVFSILLHSNISKVSNHFISSFLIWSMPLIHTVSHFISMFVSSISSESRLVFLSVVLSSLRMLSFSCYPYLISLCHLASVVIILSG